MDGWTDDGYVDGWMGGWTDGGMGGGIDGSIHKTFIWESVLTFLPTHMH